MNKKLVFGAVLLGAMTLTSCVDDTESASVTALRQAKVEQLKSIADLNKANAEAALIQANAYKAAQEAIAAYNEGLKAEAQARAAYQQALADFQNAKTEIEKDEARQRAEQAAVDLERSKAQLENEKKRLAALDAQYERDLYDNQLKALEAKESYEAAIKNEDQKKQAKLLALLETYQEENDNLVELRRTLNSLKMQRDQLEAGLISPNQSAELMIAQYTRQIQGYKDQIADAEAYIETYKTADLTTAQADLEQANKDKLVLDKAYKDAEAAYREAQNTAANANYAINSSAYVQAVEDLRYKYAYFNSIQIQFINEWDNYGAPAEAINNYCAVVESYDQQANEWVKSYIPLFTNNVPEYKCYMYQPVGEENNTYTSYEYYDSYYSLLEGGLDKYVKALDSSLAEYQEKDATEAAKRLGNAQKDMADAEEALTGAEAREKAYNDANEALSNAPSDISEADLKKLQDAQKAAETAYNDGIKVLEAENNVANAKQELNSATKNKNSADNSLADMKQKLAEIKDCVATLKKDASAFTADVKTVNEDNLAKAKAYAEKEVAYSKVSQKQNEIDALNNFINGQDAWMIEQKENEIKSLESNIANIEDQKAVAEKQLAAGKVNQANQLATLKADIENQEAKVLAQEKITEAAKKALDDAMAEETPAK